MNAAEHKAEAERLLRRANIRGVWSEFRDTFLEEAQVHATLATIPDEPTEERI